MADAKGTEGENRPSGVSIMVVVATRYTFDTGEVTGRRIKETADVPADYALYRRVKGGNEPIPDDAPVELRNGDHFFARPLSNDS